MVFVGIKDEIAVFIEAGGIGVSGVDVTGVFGEKREAWCGEGKFVVLVEEWAREVKFAAVFGAVVSVGEPIVLFVDFVGRIWWEIGDDCFAGGVARAFEKVYLISRG